MVRGEFEHVLTVNEMPNHNHNLKFGAYGAHGSAEFCPTGYNPSLSADFVTSTGGSQPHNNMPPYQVGYKWKRVG